MQRHLAHDRPLLLSMAICLAMTGCATDGARRPDGPKPPLQGRVTTALLPPEVVRAQPGTFVPCPLYTDKKQGLAQCATFVVPLDWAHPEGGSIDLFVKRIPAHATRSGAVWLLAGGPGGASDGLEWLAETLAFLQPDLDVYLPEHRGTGRSTRLSCPAQEALTSEAGSTVTVAEWPACIAHLTATWGEDLQQFRTTAAAHDLQSAIEATREPRDRLFVYGVSYGTYLAMRWLAMWPGEPTGVVLDGVCPPEGCYIAPYDQHFDATGHAVLDLCGGDPVCGKQLGPDPWQRTTALFQELDAGWCQPLRDLGLDRKRLRNLLGALLTDWQLRTYIPAVVKRVERCTAHDVEAVGLLLEVFPPEDAPSLAPAPLQSLALGANILLSEMYAPPIAILAPNYSPLVSLDQGARMAAMHDNWPRYTPDAWVGQWPQTRAPVLMLGGTLDPQTPLAQAQLAAQRLNRANQHLVTLPGAGHGTLTASPVDDSEQHCGLQLLLGFLKTPGQAPDTTCVKHLLPVTFDGDPLLSVALLGTTSLWGTGSISREAALQARAAGVPAIERARQRR